MPIKNEPTKIYLEINSDKEYQYISGDYVNNKSKLNVKHIICNSEFQIDYDHWKRGQRCPKCNKESQKNTHEEFISKLENRQPGKYTVFSKYTNKNTKLKVKCNDCQTIFEILPSNAYKGNCAECARLERKKKYVKNIEDVNSQFDEYEFLTYENNKNPETVLHKICGNTFTATATNIRGGSRCPYCYASSSIKEKEVFQFIQNIFPTTKKEKLYIDRQKHTFYEIDIYVPELKIGFELNGLYWHSEAKNKGRNYHLDKMDFCNKKGIRLINIFSDEWENKKEIVQDKIKSILGVQEERIYARNCDIKEIPSNERNAFLNKNHIQGEDKANISLGLFYNNELVAVMSFCKLRKSLGQISKENVYELSRFAGKLNITIVGGFSKLLKHAIKSYKIDEIITYADLRFTAKENNVYLKNGFELNHISKPSYFYLDRNFKKRLFRFNYRKQNLKSLFPDIYFDDKTEAEIMQEAGYSRIWDCGNLVYKMQIKKRYHKISLFN